MDEYTRNLLCADNFELFDKVRWYPFVFAGWSY